MSTSDSTAFLILEDGTHYRGERFGARVPVEGEVGMSLFCFTSIFVVFKENLAQDICLMVLLN